MKLVALLGLWLWGASAPELPQEMAPEKILEPPTAPATPVAPGSVHLQTSTPSEAPVAREPAAAPVPPEPAAAPPEAPVARAPAVAPPPPPTIPAQGSAGPAVDPRRFGATGQLVPAVAFAASFGYVGANAGDNVVTGVLIEPAVHYFWSDDSSVGLEPFLAWGDTTVAPQTTEESWTYGVAAAMGVNHRLGERVSLWARLGLGYARTEATLSAMGSPAAYVVENALVFRMFTPFLFHAAPGFFVGVGPDVYLDVLHAGGGDSMRRSFLGLSGTLGAWR